MAKPLEPEIILPGRSPARKGETLSDETLGLLASLLDDVFRIPGTNIRFGLDALVGLIPGLGDAISGLTSFLLVYAAWQRGYSRVVQARMVANIALDSLFGAIPFLGDVFDVAWKSNRKNFELLRRAEMEEPQRASWQDWLFLLGLALIAAALIALPFLVLLWLVQELRAITGAWGA